jgi:putative FmdB family regulatory protein
MPLYDYACPDCGPFSAWSAMARAGEPCACPDCGRDGPRQLAAPHLATLNGSLRKALDRAERSTAEPRVVQRKHLAGCGCSLCSTRKAPRPLSSRWAIGHC